MVADTPVIITAKPDPLPFAIVTVVPLGTKSVEAADTETIVPPFALPLVFISGLVVGKLVSFAIGTNPPTSSTSSITRKSIAAVVATLSSVLDHVTPLAIVSLESCLRNAASASVSVKYLPSNAPLVSSVSVKYQASNTLLPVLAEGLCSVSV